MTTIETFIEESKIKKPEIKVGQVVYFLIRDYDFPFFKIQEGKIHRILEDEYLIVGWGYFSPKSLYTTKLDALNRLFNRIQKERDLLTLSKS